MQTRSHRFLATIYKIWIIRHVTVPEDVVAPLMREMHTADRSAGRVATRGKGAAPKHIPVVATVNRVSVQTTLVPAGDGKYRLALNTELRRAGGADTGDVMASSCDSILIRVTWLCLRSIWLGSKGVRTTAAGTQEAASAFLSEGEIGRRAKPRDRKNYRAPKRTRAAPLSGEKAEVPHPKIFKAQDTLTVRHSPSPRAYERAGAASKLLRYRIWPSDARTEYPSH
jgi:uncharacterized protein DUF1905